MAIFLFASVLTMAWPSQSWAAKPPKPPPTPLDTGTIYFYSSDSGAGGLYSMNPDGSGKTSLLPWHDYRSTEPSKARHNGSRWFLTVALDENGTSGELFAVNEDGSVVVQVTARPQNVQLYRPDGSLMYVGPRWVTRTDATGSLVVDGRISCLGLDTATGELGIYAVDIDPDALGPYFTAAASSRVRPDINLLLSPDVSHTGGYDWSPDGNWIVYDLAQEDGGIVVAEAAGQSQPTLVAQDGWYPRWSPVRADGTTRIAFFAGGGSAGRLDSVNPYATDRKTIITPISDKSWVMGQVRWSPHGSHIIYDVLTYKKYMSLSNAQWSTYRATADGAEPTCLTGTLVSAHPLGWGAEL